MLPISACIITKNESDRIQDCLRSLSTLVSEIIVVDTGSTDQTVAIASEYTSNVFHFTWCDDFSAARNYAISKASYDWILSIDCDETVSFADESVLRSFLNFEHHHAIGQLKLINLLHADSNISTDANFISRIFHKKYYHFSGIIHEQITPLASFLPSYQQLPLTLLHSGYHNTDRLNEKASYYIKLLERALQQEESAYLYYQLGQSYYILKDYSKAANYFERSFSLDSDTSHPYLKNLIIKYGYCLLELKEFSAALSLTQFADSYSSEYDYLFLMGLIYMNNGILDTAIASFISAAAFGEEKNADIAAMSYYNIGVIHECTGHLEDAKRFYTKCGNYSPALSRLSSIP